MSLSNAKNCHILIPAAGVGARAQTNIPKQYQRINDYCMLEHTIRSLLKLDGIVAFWVVISAEDEWFTREISPEIQKKVNLLRFGGSTRSRSVLNGLNAMQVADTDWVLVHDAARCTVKASDVQNLIERVLSSGDGGLLALPLPDTLKEADEQGRVLKTQDRRNKYLAQTPQMFQAKSLLKALSSSHLDEITDEASAMEAMGYSPILVKGSVQNFKVTFPEDFELASAILQFKKEQ